MSDSAERLKPWAGFAGSVLVIYHDGRFATVRDVVEHYDKFLRLSLSQAEKTDLVAYLLPL